MLVDKSELHKGRPEKSLVEGLTGKGGRSNNGRVTVRFRGGGVKKLYRLVDFKRRKFGVPGKVERLEYDPNRTAFIALIKYEDGELAYILAPQRLKVGDEVIANEKTDVKPGNAMPLRSMPVGTIIHNVETEAPEGRPDGPLRRRLRPVGGPRRGLRPDPPRRRASFAWCSDGCMATVGAVSNPDHMNENLGKAGRVRHMGFRPHVRGVAMNPVDHPHGGGEGKTSGGRHPVTPWGKPTKGRKTRTNKTTDKFIIRSRHKAKKAR